MSRVVRNFWIDVEVDGKPTKVGTGPRGRDGGFAATIYMREKGEVVRALEIMGSVGGNGRLVLLVTEPGKPNATLTVATER